MKDQSPKPDNIPTLYFYFGLTQAISDYIGRNPGFVINGSDCFQGLALEDVMTLSQAELLPRRSIILVENYAHIPTNAKPIKKLCNITRTANRGVSFLNVTTGEQLDQNTFDDVPGLAVTVTQQCFDKSQPVLIEDPHKAEYMTEKEIEALAVHADIFLDDAMMKCDPKARDLHDLTEWIEHKKLSAIVDLMRLRNKLNAI